MNNSPHSNTSLRTLTVNKSKNQRCHSALNAVSLSFSLSLFSLLHLSAQDKNLETLLTEELTEKQDNLSGDVQELMELQTQEEVILKLEEMETLMVEATLKLLNEETNGETLAIQTEIIEKAYEAAKEKQKSQSSQSETDKALMDMLKRMTGKSEENTPETEKEGSKNKGKKAGQGNEADGNPPPAGDTPSRSTLPTGARRSVPSAAPTTGELLPSEFQEMIDDYNAKE